MRIVRLIAVVAGVLAAAVAMATALPPYEYYGYLADATDDPPVNYMKVVEPGRTGEANASYVVLGISSTKKYQAVALGFSGDLKIPAYIDGLPVRKIADGRLVRRQCPAA